MYESCTQTRLIMFNWVRKRFTRRRRAMSLANKGPELAGPLTKKVPPEDFRSNGRGPYPLPYPAEPPDDENMNEIVEENVDVIVHLPDGKSKQVAVNSNIPMMDLLVNLAAGSRLNPGGHSLQVLNEDTGKLKEYKANQTIGSLCIRGEDHKFRYVTVQIVPKKVSKKSSGNLRQFEMTKRFTVNLPGGQKKVLRISPQSTLEQVRAQLCQERQLEPSHLVFQLPSNPRQQLSLQTTVAELPSSEVNLTGANVMLDGAKSMPDLSIGRSQSMKTEPPTPYMPMAGEGKKKKGFFSFLKKDKKFTVSMHTDLNHAGKPQQASTSRKDGGSPPATRRKMESAERPKSMFVTSPANVAVNGSKSMQTFSSEVDIRSQAAPSVQVKSAPALNSVREHPVAGPPIKSGKKKRAPPPPQVKPSPHTGVVTAEITVENTQTTPSQAESRIPEIVSSNQQLAQKLHSRNSSDSSGYHELALSGAESPDTAKIEENLELKVSTNITPVEGHKNSGDSGIRDMSSPRRKVRPGIEAMETGSSQTLPLDKVGKKEMSRTKSLERAPGAKKKKAPPPPPGQAPPPESAQAPPPDPTSVSQKATIPKPARKSSDSTVPVPTSTPRPSVQKKDETVAITAVLDDLDNHLGDDVEEDQMMMVENGDLTVEEVDQPRSLRPCSFVAPPPPDEPPPEDVEIVCYNDIMGVKVDTVDIGTETSDDSASFDQESPKSSTKFQSGIRNTNEEEYKNEMAHFVERMKKEVVSQNEAIEKESNPLEPNLESRQKISVEEVKLDLQSSSAESSPKPGPRENTNQVAGDQEVSEITYSFTVDAVPLEFQEDEELKDQKNEEEEEEEYTETITEIIYPLSSSDALVSPRRIPDLDSPKEHAKSVVSEEKPNEGEKIEEAVKQEVQVQQKLDTVLKVEVSKVAKPEEKPKELKREKEEFVLTFDDLQNVDFTGPKRKKPQSLSLKPEIKPPTEEVKRRSGRKSPAAVTSPVFVLEELRSRFKSDGEDNVLITPLRESRSNGSIKERCNELSFTPSTEGEQEHVMEEKSISLMAHLAARSPDQFLEKDKIIVEKLDLSKDVTDGFSEPEKMKNSDINEDSVNNNESAPNSARDSLNSNGSAPNSARDSVASSELENDPLEQMQQQFQMWQTQLEQNQKLLASQPVSVDETSLQLQDQLKNQIEIQKQMLAQMQKSMETLAAQSQTKSLDSPRDNVDKSEVSSRQNLIPSPPVLPQMRMKSDSLDKEKKSKKKVNKRFEPKLDPREELMLQIRGFQGRNALKKVQLKQTKWVSGPAISQ
ncbi:cordon-bleu protein-like 1 isoform X9 [Ostrea edulis]|uniref:cordon-bleu protein-like 1 isoform X9 n=1 Tax=Ostrea edulis TaxID=37623 RepID=UPI0024AEA0AD|nr:cordon-bleu protein-like 1 isoform X9 [Ostrea edulis]